MFASQRFQIPFRDMPPTIPVGLGRRSSVMGAASVLVGGLGPPYVARRRIRNERFGNSHCFAAAAEGASTAT